MKRNHLLFMCFVAAVLLTGCKSKRAKFEEAIDQLIKEYRIPEFSEDEISHFNNINALAKEYGQKGEYNFFKHEVGYKSDADFERQYIKDSREIAAVSGKDRYKILYDKKPKETFVLYCYNSNFNYNYNSTISELQENPSDFDSPDELKTKLKEYVETHMNWDVDEFIEIMRKDLTRVEESHLEKARKFLGYKYLAFVHPEYCFPPILVDDDTYEGGIICAHLQLFSVKDKNCLLDKRVFAVSGDKSVIDLDNELEIRLKDEVELQINKCGIPLVDK